MTKQSNVKSTSALTPTRVRYKATFIGKCGHTVPCEVERDEEMPESELDNLMFTLRCQRCGTIDRKTWKEAQSTHIRHIPLDKR